MQIFSHHAVGLVQGSSLMFSAFQDDGPMWSGSGNRQVREYIAFTRSFLQVPVVQVAIGMWDIDRSSNQRAEISAENITRSGFDLVFCTWGDTRVARIRADWIAIGALPNEDDFRI